MPRNNVNDNSGEAIDKALTFFVKQLTEKITAWAPIPSANGVPCPWTTAQVINSLMADVSKYDFWIKKSSDWLVQQQNYDGSWGSAAYGPLGDAPSTACSTIALFQVQGKASIAALQGCNWLCKTFNHGWTTQPTLEKQKFEPFHPYSTSYALRALVRGPRENINSLCVQEGITILIRSQTSAGGWGFQPDLPPDPTYTCYVLHGLLDVRDIWGLPIPDDVIVKAIKWLIREQNPDGSWREWHGISRSPEAAGYCIYVILKSGLGTYGRIVKSAIKWLLNNRDNSGGWMQNPASDNEPNNWVTHSVFLGLKAYHESRKLRLEEIGIPPLVPEKKTSSQILREWLDGKKGRLTYLSKRFAGYRLEFGDPEITREMIVNWLLQFSVEDVGQSKIRIELALKLLEHVRYITGLQITHGIIRMLEKILPQLPSPQFVCPLGGPKDSSTNYFYPLDKIREKMKLEIPLAYLRDALNWSPRPKAIVFIDDIVISGTQACQMLEEMILGERTNGQLPEYFLTSLNKDEIEAMKSATIVYIPYLADQEGKRKVEEYACSRKFNLNLTVEPYYMENSRCFDLGEVFSNDHERIMARDMVQEIGYEILSEIAKKKNWTDEVRIRFSLGYGGFQKLIVMDRNIPRVSLPILWCEGRWQAKVWRPLFKKT